MKKHRLARLCSILLLAALLVSLTVPLASAYSDVTRSAFPDYFDAINYVTDNGLMNGTSSTQFEPNSFVSRAMVVTTLYRMAGSPSSSASILHGRLVHRLVLRGGPLVGAVRYCQWRYHDHVRTEQHGNTRAGPDLFPALSEEL